MRNTLITIARRSVCRSFISSGLTANLLPAVLAVLLLPGLNLLPAQTTPADAEKFDLTALVEIVQRGASHGREQRELFERILPKLSEKALAAAIVEAVKLPEDIRGVVQSVLIEKFAALNPAQATPASLTILRVLCNKFIPDSDAVRSVSGTLKLALRKWAQQQPEEALEWFGELGELPPPDKSGNLTVDDLHEEVTAGLLLGDEARGLTEIKKLKPEAAAGALTIYMHSSKQAAPFFLPEVRKLPAANRTSPLSALTANLYGAGNKTAASALIKEQGGDDAMKAEMALAAARSSGMSLSSAGEHITWMLENTPENMRGRNQGIIFGSFAFMDFSEALAALRKSARAAEMDGALAEFTVEGGVTMSHAAEAFVLAREIKNPELRLGAFKKIFNSWTFFRKEEAANALKEAKGLTREESAALQEIVDKRGQ